MREVDFLFVYDVKNREYDNLCLLGAELKRRGYRVAYQSFWHSYTHLLYPRYKTRVAAIATCYKDTVYRTFTGFVGSFEKVVNLQWEQIPLNSTLESESAEQWAQAEWNASGVLQHHVRYVAWGGANCTRLTDIVGVEPQNICVAGYVTLDFYRPEFRGFFIPRKTLFEKYGLDPAKKTALFISSFVFVNMPRLNSRSPLMSDSAADAFRQASEDSQQMFLAWAKRVLSEPGGESVQIIYRPHPSEMANPALAEMQKELRGFFVLPQESIKHWLRACDVVYNWNSTTAVESLYSGTPTFVLRPVPMPHGCQMPIFTGTGFVETYEQFAYTLCHAQDPDVQKRYGMDLALLNSFYDVADRHAYLRVCDFLEDTLQDNSFSSPIWEVPPHLLYYKGGIWRIGNMLRKHIWQNHVLNPLRYWLRYRFWGWLRYIAPRRLRHRLRRGKRQIQYMAALLKKDPARCAALRGELLGLRAETGDWRKERQEQNAARRQEAAAIKRQTLLLYAELHRYLYDEDKLIKRRHDKMKAQEHYVPPWRFRRGEREIRSILTAQGLLR